MKIRLHPGLLALSALPTLLVACGGGSDSALPQLTAASAGTLLSCTDLASKISFPNTTITAANAIAAGTLTVVAGNAVVVGTLTVGGTPVPAHCQITGKMNQRVSAVDGNSYAIGFEMRLPNAWNGRFFYQANGGTDGNVVPATGGVNGGSALTNALNMGFAVISSDAGHSTPGANFGIDPQARLDYGYQAAATLTPMAKSAIKTAYGKGPDRSYFGGCSNGGRHTMVAATREPEEYDGYLVGDPGFRLPLAATANIAGAQAYATVATSSTDLSTGFTTTERALVSNAVLAKCDALDGATDGMVQNTAACQTAFNLDRDVPTCSGSRDGSCLSAAQKTVVSKLFSGATNSSGSKFYSNWPFDAGLATAGWASWKFTSPAQRDAGAVGIIWQVPPEATSTFNGTTFSLSGSIDDMLAKIAATNSTYTESALSFMLPVNPSNLSKLRDRGAKMMVYHGTSDPIFSSNDTTTWYESLRAANGGDASTFARYYPVPGMNHCSGGPTADQFDMLTPLVNWVEKGQAPDSVVANARGTGNAAAVNADVPSSWSPSRSRPLCAYPKVATYNGSGDIESAASFSCK